MRILIALCLILSLAFGYLAYARGADEFTSWICTLAALIAPYIVWALWQSVAKPGEF